MTSAELPEQDQLSDSPPIRGLHETASWFDLFDQAPVGYCTLSRWGSILEVNLTASRLLGVSREKLIHRPLSEFVAADDQHLLPVHISRLMQSEQPFSCELKMRRGSHATFWASLTGTRSTGNSGISGEGNCKDREHQELVLVVLSDITSRKEQDAALYESNERFHHAIDATREGIWDWNILTGHVYFSPQWARLLGFEPDEVPQRVDYFYSLLHPDDIQHITAVLDDHLAGRTPVKQHEVRMRHKSGEYRWFLDQGKVVQRDETGTPVRMVGTISDITARKEAEAALARSQARTELLTKAASLGLWDWDLVSSEVYFSPEWKQQLGYADDEIPNLFEQWKSRLHPDDVDITMDTVQAFLDGRRPNYDAEFRMQHKDGSWRWIFARADVTRDAFGKPVRMMGCHFDITDRKQAEAAQADALRLLQKIASRIPGMVYQYRLLPDGTSCFPYASDGMRELFGLNPEDVREHVDITSKALTPHEFMESVRRSAQDLSPWIHEFQIWHDDGTVRWMAGNSLPERESDGSTTWHGVVTDITERKSAEARLRESEARLREAQAISQTGNFHWNAVTQRVTWSDQLYKLYGHEPGNFEPTFERYISAIHADDRPRVLQTLQQTMESVSSFDHQYRVILPDQSIRWVRARGVAVTGDDGQFVGLEGTCQDITDSHNAEVARASLEAQLRESQKMEAIGTLAGGIAHDFNNILAAILGNVEIAQHETTQSPVVRKCLEDICSAGSRARNLIQQILSFSRRQPTDRRQIRLKSVVDESARLLRATLPSSLTLEVHCDEDLPTVMADATQIEQVILNLATNAMQAMHGRRGHIRIGLDTLRCGHTLASSGSAIQAFLEKHPGTLVRLTVSDNGPGIEPAILQRIFDPFFTTKPVDEGTGLGLSVVHGIVQGHDAAIFVESEPGHGATFTICFPAGPNGDASTIDSADVKTADPSLQGDGSPHILYLDDDNAVLLLVKRLLERRGFRVSCFASQKEAIKAVLANPAGFDLVVTDYNMPGMHGLEVAREIRSIRLDLPVAVTSGFIDEELQKGADLAGVRQLISKPFALDELHAIVRRILVR